MQTLLVACAALVAACGSSTPSGTLAYVADDGNVHARDLSTGADRILDNGPYERISIAPDGGHVSYWQSAPDNNTLKIAGRGGDVFTPPAGGCYGTFTWFSSDVATYCSPDGTEFLPSLDSSAARNIETVSSAATRDGQTIVYSDAKTNIVLENRDGSEHRVLLPAAQVPAGDPPHPLTVVGFTHDEAAVLLADTFCPNGEACPSPSLSAVALANGTTTPFADAIALAWPIHGASTWSADGSELLVGSSTALVAIAPASGSRRVIAPLHGSTVGGAVFLDDQHVLWVKLDDGGEYTIFSLELTGPTAEDNVELATNVNNLTSVVVLANGLIAMSDDQHLMVDRLGNTVLSIENNSAGTSVVDLLGAADDDSVVALTDEAGLEPIHLFSANGDDTTLATPRGYGSCAAPCAAFSPVPEKPLVFGD